MNRTKPDTKHSKAVWSVVFIIAAAATIWAVARQSSGFSPGNIKSFFSTASPVWIAASAGCMLIYIISEGEALRCICKCLGYRISSADGFIYSAADIYFSAITPSASGGQPMCAWFMAKDRIPAGVITAALIFNLVMYTLSIIVIGLIAFMIYPAVFCVFNNISKLFIGFGIIAQIALAVFFVMLLISGHIIRDIIRKLLHFLCRIHVLKDEDSKQEKLELYLESYRSCADILKGKGRMMLKVFILNFVQRAASVTVTLCTFLAFGGNSGLSMKIWSVQSCVVIGANCIPVPGGMGIFDYIMLDGFNSFMPAADAAGLELISRSISFYCCILLCGAAVLIKYITIRKDRL